jgi:hypothetical protein
MQTRLRKVSPVPQVLVHYRKGGDDDDDDD